MSDTCSQFMCRDCTTIYSSLTQAQSLCAKTWAPSLCATTTTHTQVPHAMTTQAQNPCVTMTTHIPPTSPSHANYTNTQGCHATTTMRAQNRCPMVAMRTQCPARRRWAHSPHDNYLGPDPCAMTMTQTHSPHRDNKSVGAAPPRCDDSAGTVGPCDNDDYTCQETLHDNHACTGPSCGNDMATEPVHDDEDEGPEPPPTTRTRVLNCATSTRALSPCVTMMMQAQSLRCCCCAWVPQSSRTLTTWP